MTPELAAEGLARDVIRVVQQARRDAGLDVSDRIRLTVAGDERGLACADRAPGPADVRDAGRAGRDCPATSRQLRSVTASPRRPSATGCGCGSRWSARPGSSPLIVATSHHPRCDVATIGSRPQMGRCVVPRLPRFGYGRCHDHQGVGGGGRHGGRGLGLSGCSDGGEAVAPASPTPTAEPNASGPARGRRPERDVVRGCCLRQGAESRASAHVCGRPSVRGVLRRADQPGLDRRRILTLRPYRATPKCAELRATTFRDGCELSRPSHDDRRPP